MRLPNFLKPRQSQAPKAKPQPVNIVAEQVVLPTKSRDVKAGLSVIETDGAISSAHFELDGASILLFPDLDDKWGQPKVEILPDINEQQTAQVAAATAWILEKLTRQPIGPLPDLLKQLKASQAPKPVPEIA